VANFYTDERTYEVTVKPEIWGLDGEYKTAVVELTRRDEAFPVHAFGVASEEEYLKFVDDVLNAGRVLGWIVS